MQIAAVLQQSQPVVAVAERPLTRREEMALKAMSLEEVWVVHAFVQNLMLKYDVGLSVVWLLLCLCLSNRWGQRHYGFGLSVSVYMRASMHVCPGQRHSLTSLQSTFSSLWFCDCDIFCHLNGTVLTLTLAILLPNLHSVHSVITGCITISTTVKFEAFSII